MADWQTAFYVATAALFGASVGSFLNVCIYRLPRPGLSVSRPVRSFCTTCGERIGARDNVPLVSWIRLGGRCRTCQSPISSRYFFVEALTAVVFALIVHRFLPAIAAGELSWGALLTILVAVAALIVATFVDIELRLIPDSVTIGGMHLLPLAVLFAPEIHSRRPDATIVSLLTAALPRFDAVNAALPFGPLGTAATVIVVGITSVLAFALGSFIYRIYRKRFLPELARGFRDVSLAGLLAALTVGAVLALVLRPEWIFAPPFFALASTLAGMLVGSTSIYVVGVVGSAVFRKPAMGFGDVKLLGLLGGLAGWKGAIIAFFAACLIGALYGIGRLILCRDRYLPFGPFLAAGGVIVVLWPEWVDRGIHWYIGLIAP
jgi:leader peptidase (prepilin peptidase)/N-methyltransferase